MIYSLTRLFSKKKEEKNNKAKKLGAAGLVTGGVLAGSTVDTDKLKGTVTRYHNTEAKNVDSILKNGILGKYTSDPNNLTNKAGVPNVEGLVYLTDSKQKAADIGATRAYLQGKFGERGFFGPTMEQQEEIVKEFKNPKHSKTLKVILDYEKDVKGKRKILNPELLGAQTAEEYIKKYQEANKGKLGLLSEDALRLNFKNLSTSHILDHDVDPSKIVGGVGYKGRSLRDIYNYAKKNPGRFGKEAAKVAGATALVSAGIGLGVHAYKNRQKDYSTKAYMPGGAKDVSELTDKQLSNIVKYETPGSQKRVRKNQKKVILGMATIPAAAGYVAGKALGDPKATLGNASKMSLAGAAIGTGIVLAGHHHQKKLVKAAKEEQKNREYKTKRFGKVWEGIKEGAKSAKDGALLGAMFVPGNGLAFMAGKPKLGLGITAAGALVGAGIGGKLGYSRGVDNWKYKNDPKFKEKTDKENLERYKKNLKLDLDEDSVMSENFNYTDWVKFADELKKDGKIIPQEILKYIKFYQDTWKKKINTWYSKMPETGEPWSIPEFKEIFPMPYDAKVSRVWYDEDKQFDEIIFLTVNNAGDDGWGCYNFKTKGYGWDVADRGFDTSFKKFILDNIESSLNISNPLTKEQENLVQEFKRHI